jgi:demethylmenaquinone methyltransferase/2-methoxy-6-polyprenyl-1,4-benzoquinol methylase
MFHLSAPAIGGAVRALRLPPGSHGLDAGCGAGCHADLLLQQVGSSGRLTALDLSEENLVWARDRHGQDRPVDWVQGDLGELPFADASFDWVWCADTLWPGAVTDDPAAVVAEFRRVIRPGGAVALVYWSGQTLLAGYPLLEARLNAAFVQAVPYLADVAPEHHFLRAGAWLTRAGFERVRAKTFLAEIRGPFAGANRQAVAFCFEMFWGGLTERLSARDWESYRNLCDPDSPRFVADAPGYYAFLTYTMFWARKPPAVRRR